MSTPALLLSVALAAVGQGPGIPPELRASQPPTIDPSLPPQIRAAVEVASAAELDPKRGPGNAMEILRARRNEVTEVPFKLQLDLRVAGVMLRSRFMNDAKLPPHERAARALSTFSRLDLTEPGLGVWVKRAIEGAEPAVKARFAAKDGRRIRLSVTAQGAGIDTDKVFGELARIYETVGVKLEKASAKEADYVAKLAALEVRDEGGKATVRVTMDLAAVQGPEPRWKTSLFRTAIAGDAKVAVDSAVAWLARIGGRDLLFSWLDGRGMEGVLMRLPGADGHGHAHGPTPMAPTGPGPERAPIVGDKHDHDHAPPPRVQLAPGTGKQPAPPPSPAPKQR